MPDFPNLSNLPDSQKLAEFIRWVEAFLTELVESARSPTGTSLFAEELLGQMRSAWDDAGPEFNRLAEATVSIPEGAVRDHGLSGNQLMFKLATVSRLSGLFRRFGTTSILRRLLNAIDTLLNSILSAVPGGSAASEIKDAIKDAIQEDEDS